MSIKAKRKHIGRREKGTAKSGVFKRHHLFSTIVGNRFCEAVESASVGHQIIVLLCSDGHTSLDLIDQRVCRHGIEVLSYISFEVRIKRFVDGKQQPQL